MAAFTVGGSREELVGFTLKDIYRSTKTSQLTFDGNNIPPAEEKRVDQQPYHGTEVEVSCSFLLFFCSHLLCKTVLFLYMASLRTLH